MKPFTPRIALVIGAAAGLLALAAGCTQPISALGPIERAIDAQGGSVGPFTREVEARVHYGFPGVWHWELAYRPPQGLRLSLYTTGGSQHYAFDGSTLQAYLGSVLLANDSRDATAYRSIARWLSVTSLDAFGDPTRVAWETASEEGLGDGVVRGIAIRFREGGERYRLGFDTEGRLVAAKGPIEIPGIGAGRLEARFRDFRRVDGHELPFSASYRLNGEPFFDERVVRFVPGQATLDPAALEPAP